MKRRIISIITALALCLSLCPAWAFAAEGEPDTGLCSHHPEHIDCGYIAPTEGHDCGHRHTAECYTLGLLPDADSGDPYEVGADTENLLNCQHSHDSECGYVEADPGAPCGYVCHICPIEDLIAALPEQVTEDNADDVRARLDEILDLYRELNEDEQGQLDLSRVTALQEALDGANDPDMIEGEVSVAYQEASWNGSEVTYTGKTENCTSVESSTEAVTWNVGWYVVSGTVTITEPITVTGAVNLILADGCTLNAEKGIVVETGNSLTIYAQSVGTGTLNATGTDSAGIGGAGRTDYGVDGGSSGAITIHGGNITATSENGAGIGGGAPWAGANGGSGSNITIYGGSVTAQSTGTMGGAGIGGGGGDKGGGTGENINIYGGTVNATGGYYGAGIGGGGSGAGQNPDSSLYQSGSGTGITISGGIVTAVGGQFAAGIGGGGGYYSSYTVGSMTYGSGCTGGTGSVTISGGIVDAKGGAGNSSGDYAGTPIGNGGNAGDTEATVSKTTGIVFENGVGTVYGDVTLDGSYTLPADYTLNIPVGASLSGSGTLSGGNAFTTENLTADMISVPTNLYYNGEDRTADITTELSGELTTGVTICGQTFTVSGWTLAVEKTDDLTYTATYTNNNDNTNTFTQTITLLKSGTKFEGDVKTYNGNTQTTAFNADDTITVKAMPTATGEAPQKAAARLRGGEPTAGQMAVYVGTTQVSVPAEKGEDGIYTMEVSAADVLTKGQAGQDDKYTLIVKFVENTNMAGAEAQVEITITPNPLTADMVILSAERGTYSGTEQKPTATVAGLTEGTDYDITYTGDFTSAGEHTLTVTGKGVYSGKVEKTYTIGKATPTIIWSSTTQELTYTGKPANVKPTVTLVNDETFDDTITYSYGTYSGPDLPTDVGTYSIKASITEQNNYTAAGTDVDLSLTITKANQTAPAAPTAAEDNIKDNSITLNTITNGEYKRDSGEWQESPTFTGLEPNQAYMFYARLKGDDNHNASPSSEASITTKKTMLENGFVTATGMYTYTGAAIVPEAGDVVVMLNEKVVDPSQYTISASNNINAGVAVATLTATATETGNYSGSVSSEFTINRAALTVKANDQSITYGESIATSTDKVTPDGLVGDDRLESVTLEASTSDVPGGTIKPTGAKIQNGSGEDVTRNYEITYQPGALTINKADQDAPSAPSATAENIKDTSITLTAVKNAEYKRDNGDWQDSPVFTDLSPNTPYTFYVRLKEDSNHNASPDSTGASITTKKTMLDGATVMVSGSYTYTGAAIVPEAGDVTVKLGDTAVESGQYTISATNNTNAGTATVTVTATADGNYSGSASTTFTISPATLTITANPQTITYGGRITQGPGQVTATGLATGDTLESVTLTPSSDQVAVANKTITPSAAVIKRGSEDAAENYNITYETGALTINKDTSATPPGEKEGYELNYVQETITVKEGYEVSTANNSSGTAVPSGNSITAYLGKTLYIRKVEDDNHTASGWAGIAVAARPAAPADLTPKDEALKGQENGSISGLTSAMEYSRDNGTTWTVCPDGALENLPGGTTLHVRVKATEEKQPHGEARICAIAEGKPITVTFADTDGVITTLEDQSYGTIGEPSKPSKTDYEFQGWYKDNQFATAWNFSTDKLEAEAVTIYAKWKQVNFKVGGTVKDDKSNPVSGAIVTLKQGSRQIDQGTTDAGAFTFSKTIPAGAYNIVTTYTPEGKTSQTKTTLITLSDSDISDVAVTLPPEGVSSELEVKPNTPAIVVGGLDEEAEALKTGTVSTVTVSMTVEGKQETEVKAEEVTAIKGAADESGTSEPVVEYLDVSITKQVDDSKETVTSTTKVIEIIVPFDFSGKTDVAVLRYHDGAAQKLNAASTKADGTYSTDNDNGFLHIYASQFSTYAVAYKAASHTITFNANGGTVTPASGETTSNGTLGALPTPTRPGYTFNGWFTASSGGTKVTASTVFKEDTTIYAQWTASGGGSGGEGGGSPTVKVTGVSLNKTALTLAVGAKEELIASIRPSNASNKMVIWSTSNLSVAAVDSSGKITARAPGTAVITARTQDGSFTDSCTVTVTGTSYVVTYNPNGGGGAMSAGTALSGAAFTLPECRFTPPEGKEFDCWAIGGVNGTRVKAGGTYTFAANTEVYAIWRNPQTYTATFQSGGGTGTPITMGELSKGAVIRLPENPFQREGYAFGGWGYAGAVYVVGTTFTMPDHNVTFTAQWKAVVYGIDGIVLRAGTGVPGTTVRLIRGAEEVARCVSGPDGRFIFENVPSGIYNLIAEKDGVTVTVKQEITNTSKTLTITLPGGKTNSVVEVKDGTPAIVVGGLENLFQNSKLYTAEDKKIVSAGGTVEFKMTVEKQDAPASGSLIEAVKPSGQTLGLFLNLSITKTVIQVDGTEKISPVSETGSLIEIRIPLPPELQGKDSYTIYRVHNGVAEALPNKGSGERCEVSADKTAITIFAQKYSTYAIAWVSGGGTPVVPDKPNRPSGGGGGGGGWTTSTYAVTVEKSEHGKVTSNRTNASSGSTVTLTVTSDNGYVLDTLAVTDSRGNEIKLTAQGGGKYTFTMPSRAMTVKATFAPLLDDTVKPCDGGADCPSLGFTDLGTVGTWYHEAVDYVLRNGLMGGYGNGLFGPNDTLTRAQFAQILFNKEGKPVVNYLLQYDDVATGAWYTEAIRWATSQGIVGGYADGRFGPNDNITREQMGVMLWRYAGNPAATDKELHFTDADRVGGYALDALRWAVENGVINGKADGILDPKGLATRAQTAQMLKNFIKGQ